MIEKYWKGNKLLSNEIILKNLQLLFIIAHISSYWIIYIISLSSININNEFFL